jgi:hypothetical protein
MADNFAVAMRARLILRTVTVLSTGMRQNHRVVVWLLPSAAEAEVLRQLMLGIRIVAIGTGPRVESKHLLGLGIFLFRRVFIRRTDFSHVPVAALVILLLLFLILCNVLLNSLVELGDPPFDASEMEGLTALLTVP